MGGSFIFSLVATDVCTGWTEAAPLLAREQSLVVAGLEAVGRQLPFPVRGIDSDQGSVFINATLTQYYGERGIEFTRSRPYRKNGQAWIEQKNGAVVRRFIGHNRYSGPVAGQTMARLYRAMRRYVNYFQPSFKPLEKTRDGATIAKRYSPPTTPCDRLVQQAGSAPRRRPGAANEEPRWTRPRCCTSSGKSGRAWRPSCIRRSYPRRRARAWSGSWPDCLIHGGRMKWFHRSQSR